MVDPSGSSVANRRLQTGARVRPRRPTVSGTRTVCVLPSLRSHSPDSATKRPGGSTRRCRQRPSHQSGGRLASAGRGMPRSAVPFRLCRRAMSTSPVAHAPCPSTTLDPTRLPPNGLFRPARIPPGRGGAGFEGGWDETGARGRIASAWDGGLTLRRGAAPQVVGRLGVVWFGLRDPWSTRQALDKV